MGLPPNPCRKVQWGVDTEAAGTDAVVTLAATDDKTGVIWKIVASYDVAPAAAKVLKAVAGSTTIFSVTLPAAAGVYDFDFPEGLTNNTDNEAIVVTLDDQANAGNAHLTVGYTL